MSVRSRWLKKYNTARGWAATWRQRYIWNPTAGNRFHLEKWRSRAAYAARVLKRHPARSSLTVVRGGVFRTKGYGDLGPITRVTVHHPVSGRVDTRDEALRLIRIYDAQHQRQYGGGIGYHEFIDSAGRVYPVRSGNSKGAHTARTNSNNYGISLFGNFETMRPTVAQLAALKARVKKAPPAGLPDLRGTVVRGHREWIGQSTACPGRYLLPHVQALR